VDTLQAALKTKKPTCAGISASYSCGNHEAGRRTVCATIQRYNRVRIGRR